MSFHAGFRGNFRPLKTNYFGVICLVFSLNFLPTFYFMTEIDLKVASKFFGSRFACGSSVTGDDEIVIQGDVKDDLFDILLEKWPMVSRMGRF